MTVTFMAGFEAQQLVVDGITLGSTAAYSTAQHRTGAASIRCNPASGATGYINIPVVSTFLHFGLYIATAPSVSRYMLQASSSSGSVNILLNANRTLTLEDGFGGTKGSSAALSTGQWYWIGVRQTTGTNTDFLQVDGVSAVQATITVSQSPSFLGFVGGEASAADIYIDDIIIDDTGLLPPSNVGLALPISDNTVTGVTDNNGVTTNIWQCVSNTPPVGVVSASEAANPKKGMHFTASVTDNYIANLTTYTTLGVGASDTVLAVQSIVQHGEDITTGTKNLQNVGALTNPTVAGVSVTAGTDAGAHGASPTTWTTTFGALTTSPTVTVGASPTIQTSRVSQSRLACVDFMAMYVAWTPAAVAEQVPYTNPMVQLLAQ